MSLRALPSLLGAAQQASGAGRYSEAMRLYREALAIDPGNIQALLGASLACSRQGRHRDAFQLVMRAYERQPSTAPEIFAVGQRLRFFDEYSRCVELLGSSAFITGAPPRALAEAAVSLSTIGENALATRLIDEALSKDPRHAPSLYFRGNLRTFSGDYAGAETSYEAALGEDRTLFQASWMLASLQRQLPGKNHIERLRLQAQAATRGQRGEIYVNYALHKEADDIGDHQTAWLALQRAHTVERQLSAYSLERALAVMQRVRGSASVDLGRDDQGRSAGPTPIFIIGMFRSGTTLLERLLCGHPMIADGGETTAFAEQLKRAANHATPALLDDAILDASEAIDYRAVAKGYGESLEWLSRGLPFVTEKLPSNFLLVAHILRAVPHARFVHLIRDAADTCFANLRTLLSDMAGYATSQESMARYYVEYRALMSHWDANVPGRILDVRYDDLVRDPEAVMRRVAGHCGVPFHPAMLDGAAPARPVVTASATQVRGGIVGNRSGAWLPYADHLGPMLSILETHGFAPRPRPSETSS